MPSKDAYQVTISARIAANVLVEAESAEAAADAVERMWEEDEALSELFYELAWLVDFDLTEVERIAEGRKASCDIDARDPKAIRRSY